MMKSLLMMALAAGFGCQNMAHHHGEGREEADEDGDEVEIALSEVPAAAMNAARGAVAGIEFSEACRETEDGKVVYCLEGKANGEEYEIEVTADGRVVEIEEEEEDEN